MFTVSDEVTFGFDEWRRLRVGMLADYRPLAAWLQTDVQPNLAGVDSCVDVLRHAEQDGFVVNGNGCSVAFGVDHITLGSLYGRWEPLAVPRELFWPALTGLREFLAEVRGQAGLARAAGYPPVTRSSVLLEPAGGGRPVVVDHTYFPADWSEDEVREAGTGAWRSAEAWFDPDTGAWSGLWRGLELAGYFDPDTGAAQAYFPVLAP